MMKLETVILRRPEQRRETQGVASPSGRARPERLESFEQTILPHVDAAYNLARWLLRNEYDAQDATQEAFLRAYRFFDDYRGGEPKSWLLAIVRNTCMNWRRRERREASNIVFDDAAHGGAANPPNAEEQLVRKDRVNGLRDCIESLPVDHREVLLLREFEEMSYQQIAKISSLPIGTVMSRLARARQRLTDCMGGRRRRAGA